MIHGLRIRDKCWFLLETRKDKRKSKKVLGIVLLIAIKMAGRLNIPGPVQRREFMEVGEPPTTR